MEKPTEKNEKSFTKDDLKALKSVIDLTFKSDDINALTSDPALAANFTDVKPHFVQGWLMKNKSAVLTDLWKSNAKRTETELRMWIARNLHARNITPTIQSVSDEADAIAADITRVQDIPLFRERNILLVANNETLGSSAWEEEQKQESGSKKRFFNPRSERAIRWQQGKDDTNMFKNETIRMGEGDYAGQAGKHELLQRFRNYPSPATFMFEGHGAPHTFALSNGVFHYQLTDKDIATALYARSKVHPGKIAQDIVVLSCCRSQELLRNIARLMDEEAAADTSAKNKSALKPIFIAESEYGQNGYSKSNMYGSAASTDVFRFGDYRSTVGTVIRNQFKGDSNINVFVPSSDDPRIMREVADVSAEPSSA